MRNNLDRRIRLRDSQPMESRRFPALVLVGIAILFVVGKTLHLLWEVMFHD